MMSAELSVVISFASIIKTGLLMIFLLGEKISFPSTDLLGELADRWLKDRWQKEVQNLKDEYVKKV